MPIQFFRNKRCHLALWLLLPLGAGANAQQRSDDALRSGFRNPPNSARPRVWWHWMDGNVTETGIKLDLDWMARVGVGGFTVFQGAIDTPQVVPHPLRYMSPEWKHAFLYAIDQGKQHGFEMSIASSGGWSETGGPWVKPEQAMKKLVWSETRVEGGQPFRGTLSKPSDATGTFQNFVLENHEKREDSSHLPRFYADVSVVAYRLPEGDSSAVKPIITSSAGAVDATSLSDGDIERTALSLPDGAWVLFDYQTPQLIRSVSLATVDDIVSFFGHDDHTVHPLVEASDDGTTFRTITGIPPSSIAQRTVAFDAVKARYFRISFPAAPGSTTPAPSHQITELVLHSGLRTNEFQKRAGFATVMNYDAITDPKDDPSLAVPEGEIVDLSSRMRADGTLDWTPDAGHWMVLRFGESLVGRENEPSPAEARGLEVDKLNAGYVKGYLDHYLGSYSDAIGADRMGPGGVSHFLTDSVEIGSMNWTDDMLAQFRQRRGYDPRPWLPAMTGVVVRNMKDTNRFLWDVRKTIAELYEENHYGVIADELHRRGLKYYGEALEFRRPTLGDDMAMRSKTDIPMGAMWTFDEARGPNPTYVADLRGAASVAHLYGQNLVGAESMTSGPPDWNSSPNTLKRIADFEMALGVNRFEYHESTHQPLVGKAPGLSLSTYGQWFNRNETWAEQAGPWINYLARSSYLLQQGRFFGDVLYFYGQEAPLTGIFGVHVPTDTPHGYGFDFANADVLLHHLSYKAGRIVSDHGTSYRILYLGGTSQRLTVPVLRKLQDLVAQGAVVVGDKPTDSPTLSDDQKEFTTLADKLWGTTTAGFHEDGLGRVYAGRSANDVLAELKLAPDFESADTSGDAKLLFVHRKLADGDLYFVDSRDDHAREVSASFRIAGRVPELWDAATGETKPVSYRSTDGRTTVPLHLDSYGTVFVVFRKTSAAATRQITQPREVLLTGATQQMQHDWLLTFPPDRGAPPQRHLADLTSWSDSAEPGIKYFSGTATYSKSLNVTSDWSNPGTRIWMDLGVVNELAEVELNGQPLSMVWKAPYRVDLTSALKPGLNQLVIKVTNLWPNRMIGDLQPGVSQTYTTTYVKSYKADSPLLPSGLLGPVRVYAITTP